LFLNEPGKTQYDLNFTLLGFPVRVHPAFVILPLFIGGSFMTSPEQNAGITLIVLILVFFLSILIHELGHTLAFRYFGIHSRIVLYWMGGLAIPDSGMGQSWAPRVSLTPNQQIIVSLAGPFAGFLFAALIAGVVIAGGAGLQPTMFGIVPMFLVDLKNSIFPDSFYMRLFFAISFFANIFINLMNLAPVYPLDGGQVARQLFVKFDSWNGIRNSVFLSIGFAVMIALYGFSNDDRFIGIFFAFMAWSNFQTLQQLGGGMGGKPWQ